MEKTFCDVRGCKHEAYVKVSSCVGWKQSFGSEEYKPFQRPTVRSINLCPEHYEKWCRATYGAFYKMPKEEE